MFFNTKVSSSLVAAFVLAGSSIPAHAIPAGADSSEQRISRSKQAQAGAIASKSAQRAEQLLRRDQMRMKFVESAMAAHGAEMKTEALYSGVPGAALAMSETMMDAAMGPGLRLRESDEKALWVRLSRTDMQSNSHDTMRSRVGQLSSSTKLTQELANTVIGGTVYANHNTRLDATFGMAASKTRAQGHGPDPELKGYSASLGLILEHRSPIGLDLRLGTHVLGGYTELKAPGQGKKHGDLKEKFKHQGLGIRAEAGWDVPIARSFTLTPRLGVGVNMARVKQNHIQTESHSNTSVSAAARLAYTHQMQSGRMANVWLEPAYLAQFQRNTHLTASVAGMEFRVSNRLPGDSAGVRVGADVPVGKNGSFGLGLSHFWGVKGGRQSESSANLSYVHRV